VKARFISFAVVLSGSFACGGPNAPAPPTSAAAPSAVEPSSASAPVPPATARSSTQEASPARSLFELQLRNLRDYVHAFNRHDAKAIAALYAEDASFVERGEFVSLGGGSIESNYQQYFDAFPDATTSITRSWHKGDSVVFEYVEGGTQTGAHRAHKPTGKKVGYVGASMVKFTPGGLVKADVTFSDELTKEVQADWAPAPLAKLKVRPIVPVPAPSDAWEIHTVPEAEGSPGKARAPGTSLYANFSLKSEKEFLAALTDDVVLMPFDDPEDVTGKAGASKLFKDWTRTFADSRVDASDVWTADGYVLVLGTFSGKHVGAWGPVKPTNKTFSSHFLDIAKVDKEDKVQRLWSYANNYELLAHLGFRKSEVTANAKK
jgi:ketosteroid isomerase-like protein